MPLGRSKWASTMTAAPFFNSSCNVGTTRSMRVVSVTIPSLIGTLRSRRITTFLLATLTSSRVRKAGISVLHRISVRCVPQSRDDFNVANPARPGISQSSGHGGDEQEHGEDRQMHGTAPNRMLVRPLPSVRALTKSASTSSTVCASKDTERNVEAADQVRHRHRRNGEADGGKPGAKGEIDTDLQPVGPGQRAPPRCLRAATPRPR